MHSGTEKIWPNSHNKQRECDCKSLFFFQNFRIKSSHLSSTGNKSQGQGRVKLARPLDEKYFKAFGRLTAKVGCVRGFKLKEPHKHFYGVSSYFSWSRYRIEKPFFRGSSSPLLPHPSSRALGRRKSGNQSSLRTI